MKKTITKTVDILICDCCGQEDAVYLVCQRCKSEICSECHKTLTIFVDAFVEPLKKKKEIHLDVVIELCKKCFKESDNFRNNAGYEILELKRYIENNIEGFLNSKPYGLGGD